MSRTKYRSLKQAKIRADWNKYTLYNLARLRAQRTTAKTFFQQKWAAKQATRAFHGQQIREKIWQRMFTRKIPAVQRMDPAYMARHDGSELAEGRGQGQDQPEIKEDKERKPYMLMAYYPTERRLDVAIWRALFASSVNQGRQFVVHGYVKVNGKRMRHPSYLLNPGDMFQVEPDRVMYATGAKKENNARTRRRLKYNDTWQAARKAQRDARQAKRDAEATESAEAEIPEAAQSEVIVAEETPRFNAHKRLKDVVAAAKAIASNPKTRELSGKNKQELRAFKKLVTRTLAQSKKSPDEQVTENLTAQMEALKLKLTPRSARKQRYEAPATEEVLPEEEPQMSEEEEKALQEALERIRENPRDDSKPYMTPWRPKPYMSPFAFIPRYLEVNQNICAAVYLRHPVVRAGLAEVPSPFTEQTNQLAFNWYLRRR